MSASLSAAAALAPAAQSTSKPATTTGSAAAPAADAAATTGAAQAQQGAAQAQPAAAKAEPFIAQHLLLPDEPSTSDVLTGLTAAMRDPSANKTTTDQLYQFHQQLFEMQKAMTQTILDLMAAT